MNFLSHFYQVRDRHPNIIFGAVMPDIIEKFSYYHNQNPDFFADSSTFPRYKRGIENHIATDNYFHDLKVFKDYISTKTLELRTNPDVNHIKRANFIFHIFFEVAIDYYSIKYNNKIVDDFYAAMNQVNELEFEDFLTKFIDDGKIIEKSLANFKKFTEFKFLYKYQYEDSIYIALCRATKSFSNLDEQDKVLKKYFVELVKSFKFEVNYLNILNKTE